MNDKLKYIYSINGLEKNRIDEICEDVRYQYENGIINCALFMMQVAPQGTPVWDLVGPQCEIYRTAQSKLKPYNIPTGVLVQSIMGHGGPLAKAPFQRYVNLDDGESPHTYCPSDTDFCNYMKDCMTQIAKCNPNAIMIDDDVRMMLWRSARYSGPNACFCPNHRKEFCKRIGKDMTREEVYEYVITHSPDDPYVQVLRDTQHDSLVKLVTAMREGIDSVNPTIQGVNCTTGYICESMNDMARIFAGHGNEPIVRVPNGGIYAPLSNRDVLSKGMFNWSVCKAKLNEWGIEKIIAETDTIPYNRYAQSARFLHTRMAISVFDGAVGAKHWISRFDASELESGKAYRMILKENAGLYHRLSDISCKIKPIGCCVPFVIQNLLDLRPDSKEISFEWAGRVLERMGIPFYFSNDFAGIVFLNRNIVMQMSDDVIEKMFENSSVFCDVGAADELVKRGYADDLGITVSEYFGSPIVTERFVVSNNQCAVQKEAKKLNIIKDNVNVLSECCYAEDGHLTPAFPAVTEYIRDNGKVSVAFCGIVDTPWHYLDAFSFLNESRKKQLLTLINDGERLPVYYVGDNEICLRAGIMPNGNLVAMFINIGNDPEEELVIHLERTPKLIEMLLPSGNTDLCEWRERNGDVIISTCVETMKPLVLIIS